MSARLHKSEEKLFQWKSLSLRMIDSFVMNRDSLCADSCSSSISLNDLIEMHWSISQLTGFQFDQPRSIMFDITDSVPSAGDCQRCNRNTFFC